MRTSSRFGSAAIIFFLLLHLLPTPALADNCSGLSDCFRGNMLPAILLILGLLLLIGLIWYFGGWAAIGLGIRGLIGAAGRSGIARGVGSLFSRLLSRRAIQMSARQLQKKFIKHAADFGIKGNYNPANAKLFGEAVRSHVKDAATQIIKGTYRGKPVTHYFNPKTGLNVIKDAKGAFESGWKLSAKQIEHLLKTGSLGGG